MPRLASAFSSALLLSSAALLSGCGGAPSEGDIEKAVRRQAETDAKGMEAVAGKVGAEIYRRQLGEIESIKKIGCKDDGEKAYRCDVEMRMKRNGVSGQGVTSMRLVKTSDGWAVGR